MEGPKRVFSIGDRHVGEGAACFIVAEAGVNHNGSLRIAHQLIDLAVQCAADAVKFQTFDPSALVSVSAAAAPYQHRSGARSQRALLDSLVLPRNAWKELARHAADVGIVFLSTAFDYGSLELLLEAGVRALKVPSGELDHLEFITALASYGVPLIMSTGLATLDEVNAAIDAARAAPAVAILHCVTAYPAPLESCNLRAMVTMADRFGVPVGWSDHTEGSTSAVAAVALGAKLLEKHLTIDRNMTGPDHAASEDLRSMTAYVRTVRAVEAALGNGTKQPNPAELENRFFARRSYHAKRDLDQGVIISREDVVLLRPADGLPPGTNLVGLSLARFVAQGAPVTANDIL